MAAFHYSLNVAAFHIVAALADVEVEVALATDVESG